MKDLFDEDQDASALPLPSATSPADADDHAHQFRLTRLQTFNWGTFGGLLDIAVPPEGYLFVGPSGSGKSTLLDAHACLLTPPKWVDFNVAARESERQGKDRSLLTYVRGAWAQQSGEGREVVSQVLRPDTTWTAIAETYANGEGRVVVLAQVLWVRGKSALAADVQRLYLVLTETLDITALEFFPRHDFDIRRFKHSLPRAYVTREFSAYQERFRGQLGIASERALRLLHKTQSAKNLGDLNTFLRDFMLDAPETFEVADRLVAEFGELHAAHQAVVAARRQIDTLLPASEAYEERERCGRDKNLLAEVQAGLDGWRDEQRERLANERIAELGVDAEGARQKAAGLAELAGREFEKLTELKRRRHDSGGQLIEDLQRQLAETEHAKPERLRKRELARAACEVMGWAMPDEVVWFVQRAEAAREHIGNAPERADEAEAHKDELKRRKVEAEKAFTDVVREVRAMERQRSNIPSRLLDLRARMAQALGLAEERLPFAGELLQAKADQAAWQGAIERVLGGFARSILVDDKHYAAVSSWLEEQNTGERLFYHRMLAQQAGSRSPSANSLVRKLDIAPGLDKGVADWLREELRVHFDFECAETMQAFRAAQRAVTRQGQIKHNSTRHEKNDRQRIDDRSQWVLGFDNRDKLQLYQQRAADLGATVADIDKALSAKRTEDEKRRRQDAACITLQNLSWNDVDLASLVSLAADLSNRITAEVAARPDLEALNRWIERQDATHRKAVKVHLEAEAQARDIQAQIGKLQGTLVSLQSRPPVDLTPTQHTGLEARLARTGRPLELEVLDDVVRQMERAMSKEEKELDLRMADLRNAVEARLAEFNRLWPAEAGGLDPTMAAALDYFGKLARLQTDGLPRYEQRFMQLLREQSDQNLTLLSSKIDQERSAIRQRMELVNESLLTAPFNAGTHLVIDTLPREGDEVRHFKQTLRDALSHSLSAPAGQNTDAVSAAAEQRFALLNLLVKRLASQDATDRHWRTLVLDVRQHVEFMAREMDDETGAEIEVYRSGAGKSGGQRQKLTSTCLAAALRYQLGGRDRARPAFATVVLDEAFDKADAEFTRTAMNIFTTFGFQMIVATPLKSVMTLEPFIGGACYVHNTDRRSSSVLRIDYDREHRRLALPQQLMPAKARTPTGDTADAETAAS
ncbi:MAG: ATP-binding protein [Leptothrix sp. (in: Bacteria)]|nr:ATP-binding protein [Leptothrix sp. (in: b-proteobacteria)]